MNRRDVTATNAIHYSNLPMSSMEADKLRGLAEVVKASPLPDAYAYCWLRIHGEPVERIRICKDAPMIGQTTADSPMKDRVTDLLFRTLRQTENTLDRAERELDLEFRTIGPYRFAKRHGLLVGNSGEDCALAWMAHVNSYAPGTY